MARVELRGIAKAFAGNTVLHGIDLDVRDGEFLTVVGASGCGKSTLIRIIAGLETQDGGSVAIGGAPVDHLRAFERQVAMVFQSYALYPHMTVAQNMATPLIMARLGLAGRLPVLRLFSARRRVMRQITEEVRAVAAQLRIEALLHRRPAQLSGGQRQRVALGRAMVRHPAVFLMDEPLSNLDAKLRVHMRAELMELHARLGTTFIYVTHDQTEAMTMSDRVAMMHEGRVLQIDAPGTLYDDPAGLRVAEFIGSPAINLFPASVQDGRIALLGTRLPLRVALAAGTPVTIGLRPEALRPETLRTETLRAETLRTGAADRIALAATLRLRENLGAEQILHCTLAGADGVTALCRVAKSEAGPLAPGDSLRLGFAPRDCLAFGPDGARLVMSADLPAFARPA